MGKHYSVGLIMPIMTSYTPRELFEASLESITETAASSFNQFKLVIVHSVWSSTDPGYEPGYNVKELAESISDFVGIDYIECEAKGAAYARNLGLQRCDTELVGFIDADDLMIPGGVDRLIYDAHSLHCDPRHALMIGGGETNSDAPDWVKGYLDSTRGMAIDTSSAIIKGSDVMRPGLKSFLQRYIIGADLLNEHRDLLFDSSLVYGEDLDWAIKAGAAAALSMAPVIVSEAMMFKYIMGHDTSVMACKPKWFPLVQLGTVETIKAGSFMQRVRDNNAVVYDYDYVLGRLSEMVVNTAEADSTFEVDECGYSFNIMNLMCEHYKRIVETERKKFTRAQL